MAEIVIRRARTYRHIDSFVAALIQSLIYFPGSENKMKTDTIALVNGLSPGFHNSRMLFQSTAGIKGYATSVSKTATIGSSDASKHFIKGLKDDVKDGFFVVSDYPFYGLSMSNPIIPPMGTEEQVESVGTTIGDGEILRIADGRPANDRVVRVTNALTIMQAKIAIKILKNLDFKNAEIAIKSAAGVAIPILLTASNEIMGGFDTYTKPQQREFAGQYGLVFITIGTPSTISIHFQDFATGEPLEGVNAEVDETGAACVSNTNGDGVITTTVFNSITINSTRVEYNELDTPITIAEGSTNVIVIRLTKTVIPV
jgi:hypothetical protein